MPRLFVFGEKKVKNTDGFSEVIKISSGNEDLDMNVFGSLNRYLENGNIIDDDIFVSTIHETPIDFRIEEFQIPSKNLAVVLKDDFYQILQDKEKFKKMDYNIFSGKKILTESDKIKERVNFYLNGLKLLTHSFIDAGYFPEGVPEEDQKKIDDWMVTFEDPLQKLFVENVGVETSALDMTVEDEFLINPRFRTGITVYMMKVIANFVVQNNLVKIEEIGMDGDWDDLKVWEELKNLKI